MKIAFQGEYKAYGDAAAMAYGGPQTETLPRASFADVFRAVVSGETNLGVLPVENSTAGTIHRNYDLLLEFLPHRIQVIGEVVQPVNHCLLALPGTPIEELEVVASHPQALGQCAQYLERLKMRAPKLHVEEVYDTAGYAKHIGQNKVEHAAALASASAGKLYGLEVLEASVQDFVDNATRFVVVQKVPCRPSRPAGANKTLLVFRLNNRPGALKAVLDVLAASEINLRKLESRAFPEKQWEYFFYAELEWGPHGAIEAIDQLVGLVTTIEVLGHYPAWKG